jgi:hypothetical protein
MLRTKPRLRIVGQGARLRVRQRGDWAVDVATSLSEPCRASIAIEKALAEAIVRARGSGMTWNKVRCLARQTTPTARSNSSTHWPTIVEPFSNISSARHVDGPLSALDLPIG